MRRSVRLSVNGRFYAARPTGVQRVARQLVDGLADRAGIELQLPAGCVAPAALSDRSTAVRGRLRGTLWEQVELPLRRAGSKDALPLDPANAGPVAGRPGVIVLHDVLPLTHPDVYTRAFRRWFVLGPARAARRALRVATFSGWARDRIVETLGIEPRRIDVLPQGVEPFDRPAPPERVAATLARLGIERPFVLATGGGDPRKDGGFMERVVEAWPGGPDAAPDLVVVGAPYRRVQAGSGSRPGGRVHRPGHVSDDDLHALLTAARVFCFPSRAEGYGRPPLEAMACGTPALVGDYGPAREVLGQAATVLPLDPAAWARAAAPLLDDGDEREERVAAGRAHTAGLRWDAAADALLDVCRAAAGESVS